MASHLRHPLLLVTSLSLALAGAPAGPLIAADPATEPYIERVIKEHDTLFLKGGAGTVLGVVVQINSDGSVVIQELGRPGSRVVQGDQIEHIEYHLAAAKVVEKRGAQALARGDMDDVIKTVKWGVEKNVKDASLALGEKAIIKVPNNIALGTLLIAMYWEASKLREVESLARRLVQADPHYNEGFEHVTKVLEADPAREGELKTWLEEWIRLQPTSFKANKLLAAVYERAGLLRQAQEAYRKCWTLHKDQDSALGYARTSLGRGEAAKALEAANTLMDHAELGSEARAVAGSATLAQGDLAGAQGLLQEAMKGKLSEETAKLARYNLGLVLLRTNQAAQARDLWKDLGTPVAGLALACLERREFDQVEALPSPSLKQMARELNAAVGLEQGRHTVAAALDPSSGSRAQFLIQVAKVVQTVGSEASVRELSLTPGIESLRWQAYGHLLANRQRECEAVLAQLPEDDGYALAYRLLIADGRKDKTKTFDFFKRLSASPNQPREWTAKVAATFDAANDEFKDEKFDWPEGDTPQTGWQYSSPGTGIHIHAKAGQLVMEGTQAISQDPLSRAWLMVRQDRLKQVRLELDLTGVASATVGLELLNEARQNGVALAVRGDSRLAWREMQGGAWGKWEDLPLQIQGTRATLCIEYSNGRLMAFMPDEATQKHPLGNGLSQPGASLAVGIFGAAEPGTTWKLGAEGIQIHLRPVAAAGANENRLGGE